MTLALHHHPLASFCHKVQIALYENDARFDPVVVDLGDPDSAAAFRQLSPLGKMPALVDHRRQCTILESTIIIEYLNRFYPGPTRFLSMDPDEAWRIRMWDRFFDHYVHDPMQRIVADRLRPEEKRDAFGVDQAKDQLRQSYAVLDSQLTGRNWAASDNFSLADCAAAPALFYANILEPFAETQQALADYLDRLMARPSYSRVLEEAKPWFKFFPFENDLKVRYPALQT